MALALAIIGGMPAIGIVADTFNEQGWPAKVDGGALTAEYSAPSAGPPPWHVYRVVPRKATAVGTVEPGAATTWTF